MIFISINVGTAVAYLTLDRHSFIDGIKAAGADLKNFVKGTGEVGGRFKSLGGAVSGIGDTFTKSFTLPIVRALEACTKLNMKFESSMAKVQSIAQTTKQKLNEMKKDILDISKESGLDANEVAEATYQAISSGVKNEDATGFVKTSAKAAIAGFTDTATAVDGLSTVLNAYGKRSEDANALANEFLITQNKGKTTFGELASVIGNVAPTAAAAGLKTTELNSTLAVLTANGIQTGQAVTGIKAALSNIIKPSQEATDAAEKLNMKFDPTQIKSKGWAGFLMDVRKKIEGAAPAYAKTLDNYNKLKKKLDAATKSKENYIKEIDNEHNKISVLQEEKSKLTSKDKARKKAIKEQIAASRKHIKQLQAEAKANKQGADSVTSLKKRLKEAKKDLDILGKAKNSTLSGLAEMFGSVEALNSVLTLTSDNGMQLYNATMKEMSENTHALDDAYDIMMQSPERKMKKAVESLKVLGIKLGGFIAPYFIKFVEAVTKIVDILSGLPKPVQASIVHLLALVALAGPVFKLGGNFISLGSNIVRGIYALRKIPGAVLIAKNSINGAVTSILSNVSKLKKLPGLLKNIGTKTGSASKGLGKTIKSIPGLLKNIGPNIAKNIKNVPKILSKLPLALKSTHGKMKINLGNILKSFKSFPVKMLKIFKAVPALLSPQILLIVAGLFAIGYAIGFVFAKYEDTIKPALKSLQKSAIKTFSNISNALNRGIGNCRATIDKFTHWLGSKWSNISSGFNNGFNKTKNLFFGQGKSLGDGLKDQFKKSLGINSPSRVFHGFGINIIEGLLNGVNNMQDSVTTKFKSLTSNIKNLGNVRPRFNFGSLDNLALSGVYGAGASTNIDKRTSSNKELNFNPNIVMHVNVADTGQKGQQELTEEIRSMSQVALKNGLVDDFMKDAIRN